MKVVADSHAIIWFVGTPSKLSPTALSTLRKAETESSIVVSVATLIDLWYVTQTTQGVTVEQLDRLRDVFADSAAVDLHPIDDAVALAFASIERMTLTDPWDRLIVATAMVLEVPLVTRDGEIKKSGLVETIW